MGPTRIRLLAVMASLARILSSSISDPVARAQDGREAQPRPQFLVHYMPWFESKPVSGAWGWHWTMNHFDPERSDPTGRRDVASHHYPLIGPYDSADPDVLEYHTLLMRVAGIDGVIAGGAPRLEGWRVPVSEIEGRFAHRPSTCSWIAPDTRSIGTASGGQVAPRTGLGPPSTMGSAR
jgi:hypothetical protein